MSQVKESPSSPLKILLLPRPDPQRDIQEQIAAEIVTQVKTTALTGRGLIVLSGKRGTGKTTLFHAFQELLRPEAIICRSLALEKEKISPELVLTALFYDLTNNDELNLTLPKARHGLEDYCLLALRAVDQPAIYCLDDAHLVPKSTLAYLPQLIELADRGGKRLSILLAGSPTLNRSVKAKRWEGTNRLLVLLA